MEMNYFSDGKPQKNKFLNQEHVQDALTGGVVGGKGCNDIKYFRACNKTNHIFCFLKPSRYRELKHTFFCPEIHLKKNKKT